MSTRHNFTSPVRIHRAADFGRKHALMLSAGAVALMSLPAGQAFAQTVPDVNQLPVNGVFTHGTGTINSSGSNMTVTQTTDRGVVVWDEFDVGAGASVDFNQLGATSVTINRVNAGGGLSDIYGAITADGIVAILNPNGVIFGGTANINVGGLIASTGDIDVDGFMAGGNLLGFTGATGGAVNIQGGAEITIANAGLAALVAPTVTNAGVITATGGRVALGAGETFTLDLAGDRLLELGLPNNSPVVYNYGSILADGGRIQLSASAASAVVGAVINTSGVLQVGGAHEADGVIVLEAVNGEIGVGGAVTGGDVTISGDHIYGAGEVNTGGALEINVNTGAVADTTAGGQNWIADALGLVGTVDGGSTINLGAGVYASGTNVTASNVTIDGHGVAGIVVDGTPLAGLTISGDGVTVRNLSIDGPVDGDHRVIDWGGQLSTVGIVVNNGAENATITGNSLTNLRTGIRLDGRANAGAEISGNYIENTKGAILVQYTDGAGLDIFGNSQGSLGNEWGIVLNLNSGAPLNQHATTDAQANIMGLSQANNDMTVMDRGYAWSNRSHVWVDDDSTVTPADDFDYGNGLGNERQALHTIGAGVAAVAAGGTISVLDGTYGTFGTAFDGPANVTIQALGDGAVIDGSGGTSTGRIVDLRADGTILSGFTIQSDGNGVGVSVSGRGVTVSDNTIMNVLTGVQTTTQYAAGDAIITGNNITADYGVSLQNTGNTVTNNFVVASVEGVGLLQGTNTFNGNAFYIGVGGDALNLYGTASASQLTASGNMVRIQGGGLQGAVDLGGDNGLVVVGDGVYNENILITQDNLTLRSVNGRDSTIIQGVAGAGRLGTVQVAANVNDFALGAAGQGFTIVGFDNASAGLETAAVYFQGANSRSTVAGNRITANGDAGLMTEYGAVVSNLTIDGNIFDGQTFVGLNPAGEGFGQQFTLHNVPRQLVVIGGGNGGGNTSNVTFTNNEVIGTAGGVNGDGQEQGNTLVTIDSVGATITGNLFAGTTTRYGNQLRARGTNTLISGNTFNNTNMGAATSPLYVRNSVFGAGQADFATMIGDNTFIGQGAWADASGTGFHSFSMSIQGAVNEAAEGATVTVADGTYDETVTINRGLTLSGGGMDDTAITGGMLLSGAINGLNLSGFTISGTGTGHAVIRGASASITDLSMDDVRVDAGSVNGRAGISGGHYGGDISITNSEFLNIDHWVVFDTRSGAGGPGAGTNVNSFTFADNLVDNVQGGITVRQNDGGTGSVTITGNTIQNIGDSTWSSGGIFKIFNAGNVIFSDNDISDVGTNTSLTSDGVAYGAALLVRGVDALTVSNNEFTNVHMAVATEKNGFSAPNLTTFTNNTFDNVGYAFFMPSDALTGGQVVFGAGNAINGAAEQYIVWRGGSLLDLTGVRFNGQLGSEMDTAALLALEDMITHGTDVAGAGLAMVHAGNVYVTQNSGSIQRGVDAAGVGFTVTVGDGTFNEHVVLNTADMTLRSANNATSTIIDAGGTGFGIVVSSSHGDLGHLTIDGFTVQNWNEGGIAQGMAAMTLASVDIRNNTVIGPVGGSTAHGNGIQVTGHGSTVTGNKVSGAVLNAADWAGTGILVVNGSDITVSGNFVSGSDFGIGVQNYGNPTAMTGITISGNTVSGAAWDAITVQAYTGPIGEVSITGNILDGNANGVGVWDYGPGGAALVTISGNEFADNQSHFLSNFDHLTADGVLGAANTFDRTIHAAGGNAIYGDLSFAVSDAAAGSELLLSADEFVETDQILIDRDLTLTGQDGTVVAAGRNFTGSAPANAWWLVEEGVTFGLSDLDIDGAGFSITTALRNHGHTTVDGVDFSNIVHGSRNGVAIATFGGVVGGGSGAGTWASSSLTVRDSSFSNIGRIGVLVKGTGATADIIGNTFIGKGDGDWLDYGIEVGASGTANIIGNLITGNTGVAASDGSTSAGVLVTSYYGGASTAFLEGNVITGNFAAVALGYGGADISVVEAFNNDFSGNDFGLNLNSAAVADFSGNWWGTADDAAILAYIAGASAGSADFSTYLTSGTDTDAAAGFQGDFSDLRVTSLGAQTGSGGRIQEALDLISTGGTVRVGEGAYAETVDINQSVSLLGDSETGTIIAGGVRINGHTAPGALIDGVELANLTLNPGAGQIGLIALSNSVDGQANLANLTVTNVTINGANQHAVGLFDVSGATFDNVTINAASGFNGIEAIGLSGFSMTGGAIHGGRIGVNVWSLAGYEANGDLSFAGVDFAGNRTHLVLEDAGADLNALLGDNAFDRTVHATGGDTIWGDLAAAVSDAETGSELNLSADTFTLTSTLNIDRTLSLVGAGQGQTLIDGSAINGYGMLVDADNVALAGFTFQGNNSTSSTHYGIKVQPDTGDASDRVHNFSIADVTIRGWGGTELDLNGVIGATITNVIADGQGTKGVGVAITDSADVTLTGVQTFDNLWGSVALYQKNAFYDQALTDIRIDAGENTFTEDLGVFLQQESVNGTEPGDLYLTGFTHVVVNPDHRAEGDQFTFFRVGQQDAIDFAADFLANPNSSVVGGWTGSDFDGTFTVGVSTGGNAMSIGAAANMAETGDTVHVLAGTYSGFATSFGGASGVTIAGDDGAIIDGSGVTGRIVDLRADETVFTGFTIIGDGTGVGVSVSGRHVTVSNNDISGVLTGVQTTTQYAEGDATISGNVIDAAYGVSLQNTHNTVAGNTVTASVEGVGLSQGLNAFVGNSFDIAAGGQALALYGGASATDLLAAQNTVTVAGSGLQGAVRLAGLDGVVNAGAGDYDESVEIGQRLTLNLSDAGVVVDDLTLAAAAAGTGLSGHLTADGDIVLDGAVTLLGNLTLIGQTVSVAGVDGSVANGQNLTLGGDAIRLGAAGETTALRNLMMFGDTTLTGGDYEAFGFMVSGATTLEGDAAITVTGPLVLGAVDGAHGLSIDAGGPAILGVVGGNQALAWLDVSAADLTAIGASTAGDLRLAGQAVSLSGDYATGGGDLTVVGPVTLVGDVRGATNGGDASFGTVNGAWALDLDAGPGTITVAALGADTALASVSLNGGAVNTVGATTTGDQSFTGGSVTLAGVYATGGGDFVASGAVNLGGATLVETDDGDLTLGAVNGAGAGGQSLGLDAGDGAATLGAMGAATRLGAVTVLARSTVLEGNVYSGASLAFLGAGDGSTVRLTRASTTFNIRPGGAITIAPHLIGTTAGGQSVVFDAGAGLDLAADGDIAIGNAGTDAIRLGSMTVTGGSFSAETVKLAGNYTATLSGDQTFSDDTLDVLGNVNAAVGGDDSGPIHAGGSVTLVVGGTSTGALTAGGAVTLVTGGDQDRIIDAGGPVSLASLGGGVTGSVTTPGALTVSSAENVGLQVNVGSVDLSAPGGSVNGTFNTIEIVSGGVIQVNGEAVIGSADVDSRQFLIDNFIVPAGGVVGSTGQIQLPVGLAIGLIAPAGEGAGQRRPILVNDITRLGELLRLGYTAIIVQIGDDEEESYEQELDIALQGEGDPVA